MQREPDRQIEDDADDGGVMAVSASASPLLPRRVSRTAQRRKIQRKQGVGDPCRQQAAERSPASATACWIAEGAMKLTNCSTMIVVRAWSRPCPSVEHFARLYPVIMLDRSLRDMSARIGAAERHHRHLAENKDLAEYIGSM
jgi:hypothetical protein